MELREFKSCVYKRYHFILSTSKLYFDFRTALSLTICVWRLGNKSFSHSLNSLEQKKRMVMGRMSMFVEPWNQRLFGSVLRAKYSSPRPLLNTFISKRSFTLRSEQVCHSHEMMSLQVEFHEKRERKIDGQWTSTCQTWKTLIGWFSSHVRNSKSLVWEEAAWQF